MTSAQTRPGGHPHGASHPHSAAGPSHRHGAAHPHSAHGAAHPHGRPGTASPLHPGVRSSTPRWVLPASAGLAWLGAAAAALFFAVLGDHVDALAGSSRTAATGSAEAASAGAAALDTSALLALLGLGLLTAACAGAGVVLSAWAASATERRLRRLLISRVFDRGVTAAAGRSGPLLSLATTAVEKTANYRAAFLGPMLGALTTPLLVIGIMALTVDPVTAGVLALLVLLVPVIIGGFRRAVRPIGGAYRRTQARLTASFLEAIQSLETLVYARAAQRTGEQIARRGEEHRRGLMRMLAGNQLLILVVDAAFSLLAVVAAAGLATSRVDQGEISLGAGIAIVLMTTLIIGPVDIIGQFFYIGIAGRASQSQISAEAGAQDRRPAAAPATGADVSTGDVGTTTVPDSAGQDRAGQDETAPAVLLTDVSVGWPGSRPVITGLSARIDYGERIAIVGPSGVGKSTLAALLQAHLRPHAGQAAVAGLDIASADPAAIRRQLSVVEQRTFLFLGSIADNLRAAAPQASEASLWNALDQAGLAAEVRRMPQGLDSPVGEQGRLLSGGQAQRLAIARAWLRDAPILLLDEPTSQVDLAGEAAILESLERLAQGRTVIMIAHRPGAILAADRVIDLTPKEQQ